MNGTVLVVDDSLTVRMDLLEGLSEAGLNARACGTLAEARAALEEGYVALIVLDVMLPDGDGIDFLQVVRARPLSAKTPVLMLSTEAEVKDRVRAVRVGADDYVGKPYDRGYLVGRARELLRRQGAAPAADDARISVLVIDDSRTFREALASELTAVGYLVRTARSGEEGLHLAGQEPPSVLVVDMMMPGLDGAAVIRRIRLDATLRDTPCLLLTASEGEEVELGALEAGADAFVRKDQDLSSILARLGAVLRSAHVKKKSQAGAPRGPKRILVVDDSLVYRDELGSALRGEGFDVVFAHTVEEALELLIVQAVDCILLDLLLPGMGGEEACRRIKHEAGLQEVPLLVLSTVDDRTSMIGALGSGADDYVVKASGLEVLKARVRAQLRRKQFEDERRHLQSELLRREIDATEARAARDLAVTRAALVEELELKNKELEAFSYSVSHDLRAPLRSIAGFSQVLMEDYARVMDERGVGYLKRVRAAAQRMDELIDDMLELSRVSRVDISRHPLDLGELARTVVDELKRKEPNRDIAFVAHPSALAEGDPRLLKVLFENLLGNAWKFTSRTRSPRIESGTETTAEGETVYFVRDNGAGFNMEHAARLFAPFQRLHRDSDFPGTGIGLATAKRVVDRHGGRIWAEGAVERGATIRFTLPPLRARSS